MKTIFKRGFLSVCVALSGLCLMAQKDSAVAIQDSLPVTFDSTGFNFKYQTGKIELNNGVATVNVPPGFKYLNARQSEFVLTKLWGNPKYPGMTLGMILPENMDVMDSASWVFNLEYDEIDYVKDDDADDIDYKELLGELQKETLEGNAERKKQGYEPLTLIGWAAPPFYDKERKILHWAKEIKFGNSPVNTLNYNIRVLGRKGVMVVNAISIMPQLSLVQKSIPQILNIVEFKDGYKYKDFDPDVDKVAAWTIGGLVAGKVLAKAGLFGLLAKFGKIIIISIGAGIAGLWKWIKGRRKNKDSNNNTPTPPATSA